MANPQFTPYKSLQDLRVLKQWFFSTEPEDLRQRAIQRVQAYLTRGNVPHSIESTSSLTSSVLLDEMFIKGILTDPTPIQLSYTMSIIKFVNGLLDPYQRARFTIPLHKLAQVLGLPSYFVELRHAGTHEALPSLSMLRITCQNALKWLQANYWDLALENTENETEATLKQLTDNELEYVKTIKKEVKAYSKIRREDVKKMFKPGDSSVSGKQYWDSLKNLKILYDQNQTLFLETMFFDRIFIVGDFLSEGKIDGLLRFYNPIISYLKATSTVLRYISTVEILSTNGSNEANQQQKWIQRMIADVATDIGEVGSLLDHIEDVSIDNRLLLLEGLKTKVQDDEKLLKKVSLLIQATKFEKMNKSIDQISFGGDRKRSTDNVDFGKAKKSKVDGAADEEHIWTKSNSWDFRPYGEV
ncbi:unnamed protein product [Kuraishia capsulata CBS 1993]|uniref:Uncharacterized protein n=1 Tax=Kuraishia capsulata CBS 1993 TaxID=1382522 RepID=W6MIF0_9ASCO|nr:uncharacterized protein KUCA_T00001638001 [Kuraishia capsulata CBS 1993]CDK25668.1 unnamed protein product [Kuraishia capsulata CBS 1993]